jgi:hypothetical protein
MSYKEHAMQEFKAAGWLNKDEKYNDDMQELICTQVLELLEKFSEHGHSGSTASYAINLFTKLASFKPIVPIQGTEDEWSNVSYGNGETSYQNKRCSAVFKDGVDGKAYYLNSIVFKGQEDYDTFTGSVEDIKSYNYVKFPFTPKTFYIDVIRRLATDKDKESDIVSCGSGDYVYSIKDREQLKEVFEYYEKK